MVETAVPSSYVLSTYTYNAKGVPATLTYGNGTALSYEYDSFNRKISKTVISRIDIRKVNRRCE